MTEHREDAPCWCVDEATRAAALNRLYPDRCQIPGSAENPNAGQRTCVRVANHNGPCRGGLERPGTPCHYCGSLYDGHLCGNCWLSLEGMVLADQKALFATIDWSIGAPLGGDE